MGKVESSALPGSPAPAGGDKIGTGNVKIALILPLTSQNGQPSLVGQSLRNAADLAYADSAANDVTVLVKDDHSSPDGARAAAEQALSDGAEIVIGPLFAPDVREVSKVVRAAGKPMIAFSTDTSTATHGSYLLSFKADRELCRSHRRLRRLEGQEIGGGADSRQRLRPRRRCRIPGGKRRSAASACSASSIIQRQRATRR